MPLTANKGEWSEFYVLLKLLADQKLYAADKNLNKIAEIFYPIIDVKTGKDTANEVNYKIHPTEDSIEITVLSKNKTYTIKPSDIRSKTETIFNKIKNTSQTTFSIDEAQAIIDTLHITKIQAGTSQKADIFVVVHDYATGITPEIGFSIKSKVGAASTLLNASEPTNFTYKISGLTGNSPDINHIVGTSKIKRRIEYIEAHGGRLEFHAVNNTVFESNLRKIDSLMPEMLANLILSYYRGDGTKLSDLCDHIEKTQKSVSHRSIVNPSFYPHKVKDLLQTVALGMTPSRPWNGVLEANGGYIIVKQDGEIVCYHVYNLDQFRDYLFDNTRFETASTSRHKFGEAFMKEGEEFINLNLQIRFTS
jgi:hypothetical protein